MSPEDVFRQSRLDQIMEEVTLRVDDGLYKIQEGLEVIGRLASAMEIRQFRDYLVGTRPKDPSLDILVRGDVIGKGGFSRIRPVHVNAFDAPGLDSDYVEKEVGFDKIIEVLTAMEGFEQVVAAAEYDPTLWQIMQGGVIGVHGSGLKLDTESVGKTREQLETNLATAKDMYVRQVLKEFLATYDLALRGAFVPIVGKDQHFMPLVPKAKDETNKYLPRGDLSVQLNVLFDALPVRPGARTEQPAYLLYQGMHDYSLDGFMNEQLGILEKNDPKQRKAQIGAVYDVACVIEQVAQHILTRSAAGYNDEDVKPGNFLVKKQKRTGGHRYLVGLIDAGGYSMRSELVDALVKETGDTFFKQFGELEYVFTPHYTQMGRLRLLMGQAMPEDILLSPASDVEALANVVGGTVFRLYRGCSNNALEITGRRVSFITEKPIDGIAGTAPHPALNAYADAVRNGLRAGGVGSEKPALSDYCNQMVAVSKRIQAECGRVIKHS